jgi:ATP-dependent metalloprotease FtsH
MRASIAIEFIGQLAAQEALAGRYDQIGVEHVFLALLKFSELDVDQMGLADKPAQQVVELAAEILSVRRVLERRGIDSKPLRRALRSKMGKGPGRPTRGALHRSDACRACFDKALRSAVADGGRALAARHLLETILAAPPPALGGMLPDSPSSHRSPPPPPPEATASPPAQPPDLAELTDQMRTLRADLLERVYGQDHAVHAFVEGLFNAEVVAAADEGRKAPKGLFVFAGPPGVGKTYLAELGAAHLGRPFQRFDMSGFGDHNQNIYLVGAPPAYKGAEPGALTSFVQEHPDAVLLFDEIEKAHVTTIHLFLQLLDAGRLEDKHTGKQVAFRDTTIIFTTNAGRKLYDQQGSAGPLRGGASIHRKTILDALGSEADGRTGQPMFPAAICSRLATGYPVLFNHLSVHDLERVVSGELTRCAELFEQQYQRKVTFDSVVPTCLVLREGAQSDARTLRSQAQAFLKSEIFKLCQLYRSDRLADALKQVDRIHVALEAEALLDAPQVHPLLEAPDKPVVLLAGAASLAGLYQKQIPDVEWVSARSSAEAMELLADREVDLVLLDLWLAGAGGEPVGDVTVTVGQFDHAPAGARGLAEGQQLLRSLRERLPSVPVYLLSLPGRASTGETIDDELYVSCLRSGARGMIETDFVDQEQDDWTVRRDRLAGELVALTDSLHRQKSAQKLGQEHKVLSFQTVPRLCADERTLFLRLRQLRIARAMASGDAGEVLDEVERPSTRFADVIGAEAAKEELNFFIEYLRNPRRFAAMGLKPLKGVLLHGPPGTGKTMLARAMAGESDVAFLPQSATNFVTMYQGSGPKNVRALFDRARRYAPSIIFIDEIDAIGKSRSGAPGSRGQEDALNALLTEMDGFAGPSMDRPVFVLAATNYDIESDSNSAFKAAMDPALVRRFSRCILVDLPERASRETYLRQRLEGRNGCTAGEEAIRLVGERSAGMSIAKLEQVVELAARNAVKAGSDLSDRLLEEALETVRFGEARARDGEQVLHTARHEAGHTIAYWLTGRWPAYVTAVSRGNHGGYMAPAAEDADSSDGQTREQLLARIRVCLAGRAAEQMYYGQQGGLTTGASNDLEQATRIARLMICQFGMDDRFGLVAQPELMRKPEAMASPAYQRVNELVGDILRRQMDRTLEELACHREKLDLLSEALRERERLTRSELQLLLGTEASARRPADTQPARV